MTMVLDRVLLVDDDDADALIVSGPLARSGVEVARAGRMSSVEELISMVDSEKFDAVLCDNRLTTGGLAMFSGAEAVARLVETGHPSVLITTFVDVDAGVSIRRWRRQIPSLLKRTDAKYPEQIASAASYCSDEMQGKVSPGRVGRRTVVRLRDIVSVGEVVCADAVIPAWNPAQGVRFPLDLLPQGERALPAGSLIGRRFVALVNTSAVNENDLFISEVAPIPDGTEADLLEGADA